MPLKCSKKRKCRLFAGILVAGFSLFANPVSALDTGASVDTFVILVSKDLVDMVKTKPASLGTSVMDTLPLLEFRDIKFLRYDGVRGVESAFDFMPEVYDRLKPRLARLYMRSFVVYVNHIAVYSGIVVANDFSADYLRKSHYSGPVIVLPPRALDSDKSKGVKISFFSEDGIYRRSDDPRGNKIMIDLFKKAGKFLLQGGHDEKNDKGRSGSSSY